MALGKLAIFDRKTKTKTNKACSQSTPGRLRQEGISKLEANLTQVVRPHLKIHRPGRGLSVCPASMRTLGQIPQNLC